MIVSGRQIRAARALLEWDAKDLAQKAGVNTTTIFNIEKGATQPRGASIEKIVHAFDDNGVEFTDNDGVKLKPKNIETFEGPTRFEEFYDFIYEHLKETGGNIRVAGSSAKLFSKYRKDPEIHRNRMRELKKERPDFSVKLLIEEGDTHMPNAAFSVYKWQKKEQFPPTGFYIFGNCVALVSFEGATPPHVILIKSPLFAEAYRRFFDFAWEQAEYPPQQKS